MNRHSIPKSRVPLKHHGLVVTSALQGPYIHYVFSVESNQLFMIPEKLCTLENTYGLRKTEILRLEREKLLEFGDSIDFAVDPEHTNKIQAYEKSLLKCEVNCATGKMIKTIVILPPMGVQKWTKQCWTELFGMVELDEEKAEELYAQAEVDVPIFAWIQIEIENSSSETEFPRLIPTFSEFIEIAVDERNKVWETPWNMNKTSGTSYWETSDDEAAEEELVENSREEQILSITTKHEGYLIGPKELFCPQLKDSCVHIGLWKEKHLCKADNLPLGCTFQFNAYFNQIHQIYIAYHYEILTPRLPNDGHNEVIYDEDEKVCSVFFEGDDPNRKLIQIQIMPKESFGALYYNPQFGLIADPTHVLGPMPYILKDVEVDELWMNVEDSGPGKKLSRFFISKNQDDETREKINDGARLAENEDKRIINYGFLVDAKGTFYCHRFPHQTLVFPKNQLDLYPVGYWVKFIATYNMERNQHDIVYGSLAHMETDYGIVPNSRLEYTENGVKQIKYQFKIDVELETKSDNPFMNGQLYSPDYGIIADPDGKFVKNKRVKKYKLIVEVDQSERALTLFKLVRMAKPNEKMESEMKNTLVQRQNDHVDEVEDDEDTNLIGMAKEDVIADGEDDDIPLVERLSNVKRRRAARKKNKQ